MNTAARFTRFLAVGITLYLIGAGLGLVPKAQAVTWEQTAHWAGTKTMESNGTFPCVGFSTGLNQVQYPLPNYKAVIKYKGENCCGTQSDGDGIWIGGNNAAFVGVNFIWDVNELQFGTGIAKATTTDGTWHTYTVTRISQLVFLDLDGTLLQTRTSTKLNKPDTMALGGDCTAPNTFNWNNFSYDATFYYGKECQATTTTASVSPDGSTWYSTFPNVAQTSLYARGNNSAGQLSSLSESPGGWSQSSPTNLTPYLMNIGGFSLGTHTVTATGGTGDSCTSSGTATFSCSGVAPALSPTFPQDNQTISSFPSSYTWSNTNNFGMDSCGSNSNKTNDNLTVTLYDDAACSTNPEVQCSLSGSDASTRTSCANTYVGWQPNHWYCWKLTANNGASDGRGALNTYAKFYFAPQSGPWWNTDSGGVYSEQSIVSKIPSFCTDPLVCKFSTASSGAPGVVAYGGSSADFNGVQNVSQTRWLVNAGYQPSRPSFADFRRQVPVAPTVLNESEMPLNSGQIASKCTDETGECYLEYAGTNFRTGSDINVGKRRVVIYVPNGTVKIGSDIKVNRGFGFFGLITTAPVTIDPAVHSLDAAIFTDTTVTTQSSAPTADSQLTVNGMVVARGGVTLGRDLGPGNNTQPAEKFVFAPDFLFTLPRGLRRFQYQLTEVPPS